MRVKSTKQPKSMVVWEWGWWWYVVNVSSGFVYNFTQTNNNKRIDTSAEQMKFI